MDIEVRPQLNVTGSLGNQSTVVHSGNAVLKTLTLSLDAREP